MLDDFTVERLADKTWRMCHLYKIINKDGELVTFQMNDEQKELYASYQNEEHKRRTGLREYILKDRQIGITTFHVLYYLDEVIWNAGRTAAIIAHEREALEKIFRKAKVALENIPDGIRPMVKIENKRELVFDNINSSIYIALKVRSGTINHLHVSELAYIKEYQELKAGSFNSVPILGDITCESTGNGLNQFYSDWKRNKSSKVWRNHFFGWTDHKAYTYDVDTDRVDHEEYLSGIDQKKVNWWYLKLEELENNLDLIKQEYPLNEEDAFMTSGSGIFDDDIRTIGVIEPIRTEDWFDVYKEPENGREYCIGADTALGHKDGDASCFYVMDNRSWDVVGRWHGRIAPDLFGDEIVKWARFYNEAFVGIEENNSGIAVINTVKNDYFNLYQRERRDTVADEITKQIGWYTTEKSKDEMITAIKHALREGDVSQIPRQLKDELGTFVLTESGRREAMKGCHDDEVMAFGITLMMIKHNPPFDIPDRIPTYMGRPITY
jgi:hypothetical protein